MAKSITLKLTEDEAEIIVDALDSDLEGYTDAAKDARTLDRMGLAGKDAAGIKRVLESGF